MEYLAYSLLDSAYAEATEDAEYDLPEFQVQFSWNKQFKSTWLTLASLGTIGTLFAILGQVQPASAAYYGRGYQYYVNTNGGNLNVRSGPGYGYPVVGKVRNGAALASAVRSRNGFVQLSTGNWVASNWIATTPGTVYRSGNGVGGRYCYCNSRGGRYHANSYYSNRGGRNYQRVVYRNVYVYRPVRSAYQGRPVYDRYGNVIGTSRGGRYYNNRYNRYNSYNNGY
ncbi:hypothetical protein NUACC21_75860 [Scytonema sp. NUACC21]